MRYVLSLVSPANGSVPYVIDCEAPDWGTWPLDTMTYVTEGAVAAWLRSPSLRPFLNETLRPAADFILGAQNAEGSWGRRAARDSDAGVTPRGVDAA